MHGKADDFLLREGGTAINTAPVTMSIYAGVDPAASLNDDVMKKKDLSVRTGPFPF